jgi:hypothetical protein
LDIRTSRLASSHCSAVQRSAAQRPTKSARKGEHSVCADAPHKGGSVSPPLPTDESCALSLSLPWSSVRAHVCLTHSLSLFPIHQERYKPSSKAFADSPGHCRRLQRPHFPELASFSAHDNSEYRGTARLFAISLPLLPLDRGFALPLNTGPDSPDGPVARA